MYSPFKEGLWPNVKKTNKVDGLFVILFGPLILKIVSPLDPHSLIARRNPAWSKISCYILKIVISILDSKNLEKKIIKICFIVSHWRGSIAQTFETVMWDIAFRDRKIVICNQAARLMVQSVCPFIHRSHFSLLSPPDWRGIVVTIRAGG